MKTAHDIILKPVITENSMAGIADKKYTFKVATDATKVEIAQAVEVLFPGKRLPGHMGFVRVTVQNLTVVKVDTENNLIAVKGAVPGSKGTIITLANSVKA